MKPVKNSPPQFPQTAEEYIRFEKACGLKAGDTVLVMSKAESRAHGWNNTWPEEMDIYVGQELTVQDVPPYGNGSGIALCCNYSFPYFVLQKVA